MNQVKKFRAVAFALTIATTVGCSSGNSDASTTTTTPTAVLDTLPGTVPAPVGGVRQAASVLFNVAAPGGSVVVTLTSAVETHPDGTTNPNVVVGVAVGSPNAGTCTLGTGNVPALLQAGAASALSGTASAGLYCVQVSDVTNQQGPVAFTVVVSHP